MTITIKERNGGKLKGESIIYLPDGETFKSDVEGEIKSKAVAIRRTGTTRKLSISLLQKGNDLEGKWVNHLDLTGTVVFKLK
jgi:hypothetical protein